MSTESIARLEQAGFSIGSATDDQQSALATLSDSEVDVLVKVKSLVDGAGPDVEGHDQDPGGSSGGWLW